MIDDMIRAYEAAKSAYRVGAIHRQEFRQRMYAYGLTPHLCTELLDAIDFDEAEALTVNG